MNEDEIKERLSFLAMKADGAFESNQRLIKQMNELLEIQNSLKNRLDHLEKHVAELEAQIREPKD
jgi:chromosome segregation ATPase